MRFRALLINTPVHHSAGTSHQLITLPVHTSCLSMLLSHSIFIWEAAETKWAVFYHLHECALRTPFTTWEASPHLAGKTEKWAIIISCEDLVLCEWILTGWGRRTGSASPPALPEGRPAGSYGCTALSHTSFLFLQQENAQSPKLLRVSARSL